MTSQANTLTASSRVTANLLIWWQTLTDDDQDLLRVTHSLLPHEPYLLALLASTDCPLVVATGDDSQPFELHHPQQLHSLFDQL